MGLGNEQAIKRVPVMIRECINMQGMAHLHGKDLYGVRLQLLKNEPFRFIW